MSHRPRIYSFDLARGFFILGMTLAHTIFFVHAGSSQALRSLNGTLDIITFTSLVLLAGATSYVAYLHTPKHPKELILKVLRRLLIYVLGYYTLALIAHAITQGSSVQNALEILTFQRLVPFTEFIPPLIFFALIKIPLSVPLRNLAQRPTWLLLSSVSLALVSQVVHLINIPQLPLSLKALLIGHANIISFPILHYAPIFLLGVYIGSLYLRKEKSVRDRLELSIISFSSLLIGFNWLLFQAVLPQLSLISRWPPSLAFLLLGIGAVTLILWLLDLTHQLIHASWTRHLLLLIGQNAFAIFFAHTLFLYLYRYFSLPTFHGSILVMCVWILSVFFSLYLASVLPLNYQFSLTAIRLCTCAWHSCTHTAEHKYITALKNIVIRFSKLKDIFSLQFGKRKVYLFKSQHFIIWCLLLFLIATPIGIKHEEELLALHSGSISATTSRQWLLVEDQEPVIVNITIPENLFKQELNITATIKIDSLSVTSTQLTSPTTSIPYPINGLSPGSYPVEISLSHGYNTYQPPSPIIHLTHPLFVAWTVDWEGYDVPDVHLNDMIAIANEFSLPITHMFNPRIYTAPDMSPQRVEYLTNWVRNRVLLNGDDIGLHLHMFLDFVSKAGVETKTNPHWSDGSGYDILTTAYNTEEMIKILNFAKQLFKDNDLPTPISYRAGAWFANTETLNALEQTGFLIDSSARTSYRFGRQQAVGFWDVPVTQPPYFPSQANQNDSTPPPLFNLLEIPNNGADSYAFTAEQMIDRFNQNANFPSLIQDSLAQVTYLSHPQWFAIEDTVKIRQVLAHAAKHSLRADQGPVIFTTLSAMYPYFAE